MRDKPTDEKALTAVVTGDEQLGFLLLQWDGCLVWIAQHHSTPHLEVAGRIRRR